MGAGETEWDKGATLTNDFALVKMDESFFFNSFITETIKNTEANLTQRNLSIEYLAIGFLGMFQYGNNVPYNGNTHLFKDFLLDWYTS